VATLFQEPHSQNPVYGIVFRQQNSPFVATLTQTVPGDEWRSVLAPRFRRSATANRLQQFALVNRLHQMRGDSQRPATRTVPQLCSGSQHHDGASAKTRLFLDLRGQSESIHVRHLAIDENQREAVATVHRGSPQH
jgi:hypothetical protein